MHTPTNGRRSIVLMRYAGVVYSLFFIAFIIILRLDPPLATVISTPQKQVTSILEKSSIESPVRIIIPKLKVNAVIEYVGLNSEGEMEEPTEADNVAWLNRHPLPGELGTAVIAGHFGYKDNKPAVFDNLHKLSKGDEIYIKDSKGAEIAFVVREVRNYTPEQDAMEVFSSNDGKSHLNLITCKGTWNESLQSYDTRLVVFADKKLPQ